MFRSFFLSRRWALWAWGGLLVLVALVFITVQQTVRLNTWYGEFYDLLQKPEQAGGLEKFWDFMLQFAWIAFPFMLLRRVVRMPFAKIEPRRSHLPEQVDHRASEGRPSHGPLPP